MIDLLLFSCSVMSDSFETPWTAACQASLSITISQSFLKFMSIELVMPSNHLFLCHPSSSCIQSFPASKSFPMSSLFTSGDQSIGASASASVLPMNIQGWVPLGLTDLIFLLYKRLSRIFTSTHSSNASILWHSVFFIVQLSHPYMITGKTITLTRWIFVQSNFSAFEYAI